MAWVLLVLVSASRVLLIAAGTCNVGKRPVVDSSWWSGTAAESFPGGVSDCMRKH